MARHWEPAALPAGQRNARMKLVQAVIDTPGGSTADAAGKCGLSLQAMIHWLNRNAPEMRTELQKRRRHGPRPQAKVVRKLISF